MNGKKRKKCSICNKSLKSLDLMPIELIRNSVLELIKQSHPNISADSYVCLIDLNKFRADFIMKILEKERGELTSLEKQVLKSLRKHDTLSKNINKVFETRKSFGEKVSDKVSDFGGSWTFIISFGVFLGIWMIINTILIASRPFDPFPFILLNLVLSTLAAIQAPIIMMSQKRQDSKDRLRSEQDYKVNLKSELMIRQLHYKFDQLMSKQWGRLLEIQQIQVDMMEHLSNHKK